MQTPVLIFGKATDGQPYPLSATEPVAASQTLTLVANPSNGDTMTVGGKTYTFQTTLTNVANHIKIGASASDTIDNAIAAINRTSGDGTTYAAATLQNAQVSAAAGAGDTMIVTARNLGYAGNAIAATETFTNAGNVWGAATLAGGLDSTLSMSPSNAAAIAAALASLLTSTDKVIPATTAAAVTPSDSTALTSRGVWVGGAGDVSVRLSGAPSTTVVFTAVPAGSLLPISVVRVMAATTATNINVLN